MDKRKLRSLIILIFGALIITNFWITPVKVKASDRDNIKDKLEQQEDELEESLKPFNPLDEGQEVFDNVLDNLFESQKNTTGEWNPDKIINGLQRGLFTIIIKTRTNAILAYAAIVVLTIIYMSTIGSRDVNKRRRSYLILRNFTVLFFIYINIPLFLIWLNTDKSGLSNFTYFNFVLGLLEFLKSYSVIISGLCIYSGAIKLIISRNDLPTRLQGRYLIKFGCILLVFLNIAPFAMKFLI